MDVTLRVGDITKQDVDAIVNPANSVLLGGGGADGAIHKAAGEELLAACRRIKETELQGTGGLLPTGHAVITPGYALRAKYVVHTVGPIYETDPNPAKSLHDAYASSLCLAQKKGIQTLAFPSISTGTYGYPIEAAADIALRTVAEFQEDDTFVEVRFVLFSQRDFSVYKKTLERIEHAPF